MGKPTLLVPGKLAGTAGRENPTAVPVEYITRWLKTHMAEFGAKPPASLKDQVLVVRSETGSGKSTVLPAKVFRLLRDERTPAKLKLQRAGVLCSQPRVLTAITLAREMAADDVNYPDLVMGRTVGYQTGPVNERPARGLVYATASSLRVQLRTTPDADIINMYRFIIVDEAHERGLGTDALLMRLKRFLLRNLGNPRLPFVILASATLPVQKYTRYFGLGPENVVEVEGRAYPVEYRFPPVGTNDYPAEAARVAVRLHEENAGDDRRRADILIFMPGMGEIETVVEHLNRANLKYRRGDKGVPPPFDVLKLDRGEVTAQGPDFLKVTADPDRLRVLSADGKRWLRPARRVIVSTVVAETGLTIETLGYVIDGGWYRGQESYFPGGYTGLVTRPAPKSRIRQRAGRSGRKFPGVFCPLYTEKVFNQLPEEQMPDIVTEGAEAIFLDIVAACAEANPDGVFRVEEIDMLDPPPVDALASALEKALTFGYLAAAEKGGEVVGHRLTPLGEIAARFHRLSMSQAQVVFAGYLWGASIQDLALVAALVDSRDLPFLARPDLAKSRRLARRACFRDPRQAAELRDDFLEAVVMFGAFVKTLESSQGDLEGVLKWCDASGFDFDGAVSLARLREEVVGEIVGAGLNPFWGSERRLGEVPPEEFGEVARRLKMCVYAGLQHSVVRLGGDGKYRGPDGRPVDVNPSGGVLADHKVPPARLATNTVRLRAVPRTPRDRNPMLMYRLVPGLISVLDGAVPEDPALAAPAGAEGRT